MIWGEFRRLQNRPILRKKPMLQPMKMVDLGKCWTYVLGSGFLTTFKIVRGDLG